MSDVWLAHHSLLEKGVSNYLSGSHARSLGTHDEVGDALLLMDLEAPVGAVLVAPRRPLLAILTLFGDKIDLYPLATVVITLELAQVVLDLFIYLNAGVSEIAIGSEPALANGDDGSYFNFEHVLAKQELLVHNLKRRLARGRVGSAGLGGCVGGHTIFLVAGGVGEGTLAVLAFETVPAHGFFGLDKRLTLQELDVVRELAIGSEPALLTVPDEVAKSCRVDLG